MAQSIEMLLALYVRAYVCSGVILVAVGGPFPCKTREKVSQGLLGFVCLIFRTTEGSTILLGRKKYVNVSNLFARTDIHAGKRGCFLFLLLGKQYIVQIPFILLLSPRINSIKNLKIFTWGILLSALANLLLRTNLFYLSTF